MAGKKGQKSKVPTSYGGPRENRRGDPHKAASVSMDARMFRDRWRKEAAKRTKVLTDIADGKLTFTEKVMFKEGVVDVERSPDFADRMRAVETLAKFGVPAGLDVTSNGQTLSLEAMIAGSLKPTGA